VTDATYATRRDGSADGDDPLGGGYDVIAAEVHRKALDEIAREMSSTLVRTSGSPVVTEARDLSCSLLDEQHEQIGFATFVAFHVATSVPAVAAVVERYDLDDLRPGDAFIANDPHTSGTTHQGDIGLVMPYFHNSSFVGWGYVNEHVLDVGGAAVSGFAPEARDCYSEGLRFPGVRIVNEGRLSKEWAAFIATNVRVPVTVLNDIRSMVASLMAGQRRLHDLLDETGIETHRRYNQLNKDLCEKMVRQRVSRLRDGDYEGNDWIEYDGHGKPELYAIQARLLVRGDELTVELRGVPQVDSYVNGAPPAVIGQAMTTIQTMFLPDVPVNAGLWRAIHFDLGPPGTIVNAAEPAAVSAGHIECGMRVNKVVGDVLAQALSLSSDPALRARSASQPSNGQVIVTLSGIERRRGQPTVIFPLSATVGLGGPAQTVADGLDTYSTSCNIGIRMAAVEVDESTGPILTLWRRIQRSSGGGGTYRGGQGMATAMAIRGADEMTGTAFNTVAEVPPRGFGGGFPGAASHYHIIRGSRIEELFSQGIVPTLENLGGEVQIMAAKTGTLTVREGDVFVIENGGGGGLGDPLLRDPALVAKDVADGYVAPGSARDIYGVVLSAGDVDLDATSEERLRQRRGRLGRPPARELHPAPEIGVSVAIAGTRWTCSRCGADLGDLRGNYRDACVEVAEPVSDVFRPRGMHVRARTVAPRVEVRSYYCGECGSSVCADIELDDSKRSPAPRLRPPDRSMT
jgi:N-methylhydantoinase B